MNSEQIVMAGIAIRGNGKTRKNLNRVVGYVGHLHNGQVYRQIREQVAQRVIKHAENPVWKRVDRDRRARNLAGDHVMDRVWLRIGGQARDLASSQAREDHDGLGRV